MDKFGKSQPVKRFEDERFLTGAGRYVDDIAPAGALHGFLLRSPVAHGTISALNVSDALDMPGVHMVLTGQDLLDAGCNIDFSGGAVKNRDGSKGAKPLRPILAVEKVRHVGEAVALIVADSLLEAKDAAEVVELEIDDLPAHVTLGTGGEALHEEAPDNMAFDWGLGDEAGATGAIASAAHIVRIDIPDNRIICNAMETRGCYAEMDGDRLHFAFNGMSERTEGMLTDNAGRDLVTTATMGFDKNFKIVGYHLDTVANMGAYNSGFAQFIQTDLFSKVMMGTYDVQDAYMRCVGVFTNTTPVDAYRGAGRPEAIFVLERTMDEAARRLGIDPLELRMKNFIAPDNFPYTSATGVTYDVGEFARVLTKASENADMAGFAARKAKSSKLRGQGVSYYIESILGDPEETTRVDFADDGALIFVGTQSNGQGHETVFPQFLADHTGIPAEKIKFVQGDSDRIAKGGGTGGSRSVTVQNTATLATVDVIKTAFSAFLAEHEGVNVGKVSFDEDRFRIEGSNLTPSMLEVAEMAREAGRDDLMTHTATITLESRSFPNGAHIAEVEIDQETGVVSVERYTVVDDFGNLINPMLVEGQVHGGVVQGIGQALSERTVYDEDGQLLTASFMDYGMPRADDAPMMTFATEGTPSKYNPMGMKGCGEAGTVGALAAVSNAVIDALWDVGVREIAMPFTPMRVWQAIQDAKSDSAAA